MIKSYIKACLRQSLFLIFPFEFINENENEETTTFLSPIRKFALRHVELHLLSMAFITIIGCALFLFLILTIIVSFQR